MCEFTVLMDDGKEKRQVAKNVIKAKMKDGRVTMIDSAGGIVKMETRGILALDTIMAELVLQAPDQGAETKAGDALLPELQALKAFHGHLGPYVVLGYRMGRMARQAFGGRISSTVRCGTKRPMSCLADGVQYGSGCTLGKGNISITEEGVVSAIFTDGTSSLEYSVPPYVLAIFDGKMTHENEEELSVKVFSMADDQLFEVHGSEKKKRRTK